MLVDCGSKGEYYKLGYRLPGTTMKTNFFELKINDDFMLMCTLINPKNKYVEMCVSKTHH